MSFYLELKGFLKNRLKTSRINNELEDQNRNV